MSAIDHRASQALAREGEAAARHDIENWSNPQPFLTPTEPAPYPVDVLPDLIRGAVQEVQAFVKAPTPLVASSALCSISIAVQGVVDVQRGERLVGPSSLYFLSVAESGERKSSCDRFFTRSISEYQRMQKESLTPLLREYEASMKVFESREAGLTDRLRQLSREGKSSAEIQQRLFELQHEKPKPPRIPRLLYADVTPEALALGMQRWPSAGLVSAEAGVVFGAHAMSSETVMRNLAQLNGFWDGATLTVDRKTTESIEINNARLTVGLQIQSATLDEFRRKNGSLARGSGFWARFLIAVPLSTQGTRYFEDAPADWPRLKAYERRIVTILETPISFDAMGNLTPNILPLTHDAKNIWVQFHDDIESQLTASGDLADVRDFASKCADNAVRIAACFHVFEARSGGIDADVMRRACVLALWHLKEAQRYFASATTCDLTVDMKRLENWLVSQCRKRQCRRVTKRDVMQFGPGSTRRKARLDPVLAELAELNRLRFDEAIIEINPKILSPSPEGIQ